MVFQDGFVSERLVKWTLYWDQEFGVFTLGRKDLDWFYWDLKVFFRPVILEKGYSAIMLGHSIPIKLVLSVVKLGEKDYLTGYPRQT